MRKLKFRVWDKLEKRFIYPDKGYQGHYILTLGGEFYNLQNGSRGNEYITQQYTGIKDKYEKEVYEGDIISQLEFEDWGDIDGEYRTRMIVFRSVNNSYGFYETGWFAGYTKIQQQCEIIGNVFENPELL